MTESTEKNTAESTGKSREEERETGTETKSGIIAVLGRPSVGKSTLLNTLCGEFVSITAPLPQTTRNRIKGIFHTEREEFIFLDTPGYCLSEKKMILKMKDLALSSLKEADVVLYIVDSTRKSGDEEEALREFVFSEKIPVLVGINKIDLPASRPEECRTSWGETAGKENVFCLSAVTGEGVDAVRRRLTELIPSGPFLYEKGTYTDQNPEFRITEIIREQIINKTYEELPHACYVEIADVQREGRELRVRAFIRTESESQKRILIGEGARKIKWIRIGALKRINKILPYSVRLDLRVKVKSNWRKNPHIIKKLFF